jgi:hypothetical protein
MVRYSDGIIYKLCCKNLEIKDIYIGSTTNFIRRKNQHKSDCNNVVKRYHYNLNVYKCIRKNGNFENWDMIEVEKYKAIDKNDLHKRERFWIEQLVSTLNCQIPTQTQKEYYEKNVDTIAQNKKEYYKKNVDTIKEYHKKYYEQNTETILQQIKKYREQNVEKILQQKKQWYEQNAETILQKHKEKITCECGSVVTKNCLLRHKKTEKHIKKLSLFRKEINVKT